MADDKRSTEKSPEDDSAQEGVSRRDFVRLGAAATLASVAAGCSSDLRGQSDGAPQPDSEPPAPDTRPDIQQEEDSIRPADQGEPSAPPNFLIVMLDESRQPIWFPQFRSPDHLPVREALRSRSVHFGRHHIAATPCSPSRATFLTGLYAHQTNCYLNCGPIPLDARFPTYGSLLRDHFGYSTAWFGKWHLGDAPTDKGFDFWEPNPVYGGPTGGTVGDPLSVSQFREWMDAQPAGGRPFCATVSLVNPHDVCFWHSPEILADYPVPPELLHTAQNPPSVFKGSVAGTPINYEHDLSQKTRVQRAKYANTFPPGPPTLQTVYETINGLLDRYLLFERYADFQLGLTLDALEASGHASNTIVIFTSDHGDLAGSHGMRGKGDTGYREAIEVPLMVHDPTGRWTDQIDQERMQLSSHVDIAPMLFTMASGGDSWRQQSAFEHLAGRHDLTKVLKDASAAGRPYVVTTSDIGEANGRLPPEDAAGPMPHHVISLLRDGDGNRPSLKLVTTNHWGGLSGKELLMAEGDEELELYDHGTPEGLREVENLAFGLAADNPTLKELLTLRTEAMRDELRQPLEDPILLAAAESARQAYMELGA